MKRIIIFFLLISFFLSSCGTTMYQLKTDCSKVTVEELFKSITALLIEEDFIVKQSDLKLGYLQAETMPEFNVWLGMNEIRVWSFQDVNGKIKATAKVVYTKKNIYGSTTGGSVTYYNDDAHEDWTWYWNIRNGLERICGNKIVIVKKKKH